jgi:hypothetical protein
MRYEPAGRHKTSSSPSAAADAVRTPIADRPATLADADDVRIATPLGD